MSASSALNDHSIIFSFYLFCCCCSITYSQATIWILKTTCHKLFTITNGPKQPVANAWNTKVCLLYRIIEMKWKKENDKNYAISCCYLLKNDTAKSKKDAANKRKLVEKYLLQYFMCVCVVIWCVFLLEKVKTNIYIWYLKIWLFAVVCILGRCGGCWR